MDTLNGNLSIPKYSSKGTINLLFKPYSFKFISSTICSTVLLIFIFPVIKTKVNVSVPLFLILIPLSYQ